MSIVKKCSSYLKERSYLPRLTVKGLIIYCANNVANIETKKFDWADALVDAAIISGLTFFSTLGGGSVAGLEGLSALKAAAVAACAQFFIFLALKRGIVQPKEAIA
ncbi:MAG: hypothetical protein ACM3UY_06670 [Methanocella sp.]|jgi:hypothetical protein